MNSETIKAITPVAIAICGTLIAIASLFSPAPKDGLNVAAIFGAGAAGAYQSRVKND
jgi:hypothetical protein